MAGALKEITETAYSASFLDIYLKFDINGKLSTKLSENRRHQYWSYISQPVYDARASSLYSEFHVTVFRLLKSMTFKNRKFF